MSMLFKRIKDWATSITTFRSGDVIPVDGPSGTAKMSKDNLLKETADNALAGNLAPAFDPTRTAGNPYLEGDVVVYQGKLYTFKVSHYGAWSNADVKVVPLNDNILINKALSTGYEIFDDITFTNNKKIVASTGSSVDSSFWKSSFFVDVGNCDSIIFTMGTMIEASDTGVAFYDKNRSFISGITYDTASSNQYVFKYVQVPDGASFARFSAYNNDSLSGSFKLLKKRLNCCTGFSIDSTDKTHFAEGYRVLATDGTIETSSVWAASDFVSVDKFESVEIGIPCYEGYGSTTGVAFYDHGKNFISDSGISVFSDSTANRYYPITAKVPTNAAYMRCSRYIRTQEESANTKFFVKFFVKDNFFEDRSTTLTAFREGDVIPVDGPSGTAKMSKETLLAITAQNAVDSGVAASKGSVDNIVERTPVSVIYSSESLESSMFSAGNIDSSGNINTSTGVLHSSLINLTGNFLKAVCDSFFYRVSIAFYDDSTFISRTNYAAINGILVAKAPVGATRFRVQFWKAAGGGDAVYADSGIAVWQGEPEYEEIAASEVVDNLVDIKDTLTPYGIGYTSVAVDSSMFTKGSINPDGSLNTGSTGVMYSDFISVEGKDFVKASVQINYRVGAAFYGDNGFISRTNYAATGQDLEEEVPKSAKYCRVQFWAYLLGTDASYSDAGVEIFTGVKNYKKSADKDSLDSLSKTREMYAGDVPVVFEQGAIYSASGYNSQNNSSWYTKSIRSNFIRVEGLFVVGVQHTAGFSFQAYLYNSNKEYISSTDSLSTCRYLRHTGYIRISITKTDQSDLSPSDITLDDIVLPTFFKDVLDVVHDSELFMPSFNLTSESVLNYLDGLASDYSHYITEHGLLTMDSSGTKKINYYKLGTGAKKIAIVSGQHGPKSDPFDSVITLCALIRSLCKNEFSKDDFLYKLKTEYTLYIIPILNPYGIDNYNWSLEAGTIGGRNNSNGVNLNRDWADQTQIETQKAAEALEAFAPSAVIDLHATGNFPNEGSFGGQWGWLSDKAKAIAFTNIINPAHWRDYNIESSLGYSNDMSAVSGTSLDSWAYLNLNCVGCTCECQYMIRAIPTKLHTPQVESANFSFLVNTIAINAFAASLENDYSYILTRPQKGA